MIWYPVEIKQFQAYLPNPVKGDGEVFSTTKLNCVREAGKNEDTLAMAKVCVSNLLKQFEDHAGDLSHIIFSTTSPDFVSPSHASNLIPKLPSFQHVHAFDVQSSCSSFMSGMRALIPALEPGKSGILVASEAKRRSIKNDLKLRSLIGDASAAVLFSHDESKRNFISFPYICSYPEKFSLLGTRCFVTQSKDEYPFEMFMHEGRQLYRDLVSLFTHMIVSLWNLRSEYLSKVGVVNFEEIGGMIYVHQANRTLLLEVKKRLPAHIAKRLPILMTDTGNTVSVTLPLLMKRIEDIAQKQFSSDFINHDELSECARNLEDSHYHAEQKCDILLSIGGGMQLVSAFVAKNFPKINELQ